MSRLLITVILLLGALAVGLLYLRPEWSRFQALRAEGQSLQNTAAELDDLLENRDKLILAINALSKEDLKRINQAFPVGPQASEFLVMLEGTASKNGVSLRGVDLAGQNEPSQPKSTGQPKPGGIPASSRAYATIRELPFNLRILGSYESITSFLEDLEESLRMVSVQEIVFTAPGSSQAFDVTIKAKTYYQ